MQRIMQELGRTHRRASCRRRQQPLPEVREKDRVDELGLAAREFRDECDDQLVLVEPLDDLRDLEVDLRVSELLLTQPRMEARNAYGQAPAPIAVRFETRCEVARRSHARTTGRKWLLWWSFFHSTPIGLSSTTDAAGRRRIARPDERKRDNGERASTALVAPTLSLAARAVVRRTLALARCSNRRSANAAGRSSPIINVIIELEIARLTARIDIIPERAAPFGDRVGEHVADFVDQSRRARPRQSSGRTARPDSGAKQRFIRIDVADTHHEAVVHQRDLDRRAAPSRCR